MKVNKIEEIKNVIASNGGEVRNGDISYYVDGEYVKVLSWHYDRVLNDKYDEELNHHLSIIKRGIKQKIIMGLYEDGEAKCDLATADALATEGFITIENYEDGVLYGEIDYDAVLRAMFDGDEYEVMQSVADYDAIGWEDLEIATDMYDNGFLTEIGYDGVGNWYGVFNWNDVITDFCKRWNAFFHLGMYAA